MYIHMFRLYLYVSVQQTSKDPFDDYNIIIIQNIVILGVGNTINTLYCVIPLYNTHYYFEETEN